MCLLLDDADTKQAWGWKHTVKHTAAPMTEGGERTKTPEIGAHGPGPVASGSPPRAQPNGLKLRSVLSHVHQLINLRALLPALLRSFLHALEWTIVSQGTPVPVQQRYNTLYRRLLPHRSRELGRVWG